MTTFGKNQVIIREDGSCPNDALIVVGYGTGGSLLSHPIGCRWDFDEAQKFFCVSGENAVDEAFVYPGQIVSLPDGATEKVYGIGAGDWIWDKS